MLKKRYKPEVGQLLYSLNVSNSAGRHKPQTLTPVTVTSVRKKYFTCTPVEPSKQWRSTTFEIDTWREKTEYSSDEELYDSAQEWADEFESNRLISEIRGIFNAHDNDKIPLDVLRSVRSLLPNVV